MNQTEVHNPEPAGGGMSAVPQQPEEKKNNYGKYAAFGIIIAVMIAGIIYAIIR
jgi:hypothetical protein